MIFSLPRLSTRPFCQAFFCDDKLQRGSISTPFQGEAELNLLFVQSSLPLRLTDSLILPTCSGNLTAGFFPERLLFDTSGCHRPDPRVPGQHNQTQSIDRCLEEDANAYYNS